MRQAFSDTGIVLKSVDFAEADKLVGILSHNHGYQEFVARGARRLNSKKAPHLDLFNKVKFQAGRGNSPQQLIQADTEEYFPQLKSNLEKVRIALSIAEILTSILPHEEEDRESYLSLANFYTSLNKSLEHNEIARLTNDYSLYLLRHLGYPQPKVLNPSTISVYFENLINKKIVSRSLK
ncbi:MAG: repair protein RecO protein [Candidatus Collierbacteria bacterium GW2011_GWF2_44_15]|uniref:Repair protein RecO protein n=4 Tax=Candidatus Collieribacteriota TaxID=1752725 RepID=A0A0G1KBL0_9BACT|nr:MAG: repair protein RecO protein [Candidatus Collierbacteria bacterium GW2011_GWA1_44_12]KKT37172.1 MAG: repair protein RecO protein [Candidatus Collierbacteria bacterium GW2011_GWF1_44_12]KKT45179.1 MAG: repair protein RecO protein [Candidatus Collierbacteria bacterium GW2011_GWF2_44_15]KKT96796.1 MAG: repair protein RecO protein [Candidatus Collierbacteria bacterium GW2011_GWC2_45_15]